MLDLGIMESAKKELSLSIDAFDKPTELTDVRAWSQLMLNLIFLSPGTYPSIPEMGVGIADYQYDFLDSAVSELSTKIQSQQQAYLPDIPVSTIQVSTVEQGGVPILIISILFSTTEGTKGSAIAIRQGPNKFLDFDVSW